jgi:4-hydroxybenzoate polyprenyltransferase
MRPQQWIKNLFIFAPLVFAGHLFHRGELLLTVEGFFLFSFLASGVYIFNDLSDLEKDKLHPLKSHRPLPSGKLAVGTARVASALLIGGSVAVAFVLSAGYGSALAL